MTASKQLLVEIGTEELPPKALRTMSDAFAQFITEALDKAQIEHGDTRAYATPRRLAVSVLAVASHQPDRETLKRGPALAAARNADGEFTPAALGFARSCGVEPSALETLTTEQGSWLCYRVHEPGRSIVDLLPELVTYSLGKLPIPKRMRWSDKTVEFVRPVHWAVLLLGSDVVEAELLGVATNRYTYGHRFHHAGPLSLASADEYVSALEQRGRVLVDFDHRRDVIVRDVTAAAQACGGQAVIGEELLDEVTALVEWPVAIAGEFDPKFLDVPAEVLIATMKDQQRYFHMVDSQGQLLPRFVTVANIESSDPSAIRRGNERVVTPRLTDAAFFWEHDRRVALHARREQLRGVVFQKQLGTLFDKSERMAAIAKAMAGDIGADPMLAERGAQLAKCDLMSDLVGEFPALQGTMGRYYASGDGEPAEVAAAIEEHYRPRYAGDDLPSTRTGMCVALADKLDTLVGIFGIGQIPSGDKDPFALRRAALGILRIIVEHELSLDLHHWVEMAMQQHSANFDAKGAVPKVMDYLYERMRGYLLTNDLPPDIFEAVLVKRPTRPLDFLHRLQAVAAFRSLPASESLAAANKRISNILKQSAGTNEAAPVVDPGLLVEPAERALAEALNNLEEHVRLQLDRQDYANALQSLAGLRPAVDAFFDEVLVMAEDVGLRRNRLALLQSLHGLFLEVADISKLHG